MSQETILDRIMSRKKEEIQQRRRQRPEGALLNEIKGMESTRGFAHALIQQVNQERPAVIAEIKRASPSKGLIIPNPDHFNPAEIALGYFNHGASCLSCLTDRDFFQGDERFVQQIRQRVTLPVLRKDFICDPYQVIESRAVGADALLLIMAVLSTSQAQELESAAFELGLDVLIEVHNEAELEAAHRLKSPLMGVNNRNLKTFETSLDVSLRLAALMETDRIVISESGIANQDDIRRLRQNSIHAYLIGSSFMKSDHPGVELGKLLKPFLGD
ncbi:MAG: indole-3-glycerol phosphate synthase TrpC [Magnetococcales bacterium]|nr:indole-3-glycerol phosphate synthase TrpC [Magnetococcales bacterium]